MVQKSGNRATYLKSFVALVCVVVVASVLLITTGTTASAQSPTVGESVYRANCIACHSLGSDWIIGPGFYGLADRADSAYIRESIVDPGAVIVDGFQNIMPTTFGASLSSSELDDLVAFLGTLSASAGAPPEPELISAPASDGNAERGENLFTGPSRFENRGPSCAACHSSSGIGAFGGGTLGPDLTGAYAKLGDALIVWPESVAPMSPIFTERPLTDQEKADLLAFFRSADITERETAQVVQLFGFAVGGVVVIAIFTQLIWRRRLSGVRKGLVGSPTLTTESNSGNILKRVLTGLLWEQSGPSSRR